MEVSFETVTERLKERFGEELILEIRENSDPKTLCLPAEKIAEVCEFLRDDEHCYFDMLSCLTGLDNGPKEGTLEVVYHLYSIPYEYKLGLSVSISRNEEDGQSVPSVCDIWQTANWHEREAYDLVGIRFSNHPDLHRVLLPADWEGHPLRKDYKQQEKYHGITVEY
ncbi:NADH-quinone oxidoreductase subunit C [Fulvitalea axinellae]|uniref:NADH-quinone oxidoreductase subunit C n=1 Tax=Fulvitalea axinellae TaxID=1182444 RepID=A0AAU9C6X5_9BACT|nr:NADH-quinone oxidoreductase subunit C [Fulvitalea axinellae]